MNTINVSEYSVAPLYNMKAVVNATNISSSTLRAWERRYEVTQPQRSESGYRLYSDRDIVLIRWLKTQVDTGMAISQAVAWLGKLTAAAGGLEALRLPATPERQSAQMTAIPPTMTVRDFANLQRDLLQALLQFKEQQAEVVLAEAFSLYPIELVGEKLIAPVLVEIGQRWHRGEISITHEHFATAYLQQRLATLLRTVAIDSGTSLIWVGCVTKEEHEIGALLLTIYLRRAGYRVQYMGKDLPTVDLTAQVKQQQPAIILLSATTEMALEPMQSLTQALSQIDGQRPLIGFGGRLFQQHPELRSQITGIYMGDTALEAVERINELTHLGE